MSDAYPTWEECVRRAEALADEPVVTGSDLADAFRALTRELAELREQVTRALQRQGAGAKGDGNA